MFRVGDVVRWNETCIKQIREPEYRKIFDGRDQPFLITKILNREKEMVRIRTLDGSPLPEGVESDGSGPVNFAVDEFLTATRRASRRKSRAKHADTQTEV